MFTSTNPSPHPSPRLAGRGSYFSSARVSRNAPHAVRANFGLGTRGGNDYAPLMALARILVDGYSLLHY